MKWCPRAAPSQLAWNQLTKNAGTMHSVFSMTNKAVLPFKLEKVIGFAHLDSTRKKRGTEMKKTESVVGQKNWARVLLDSVIFSPSLSLISLSLLSVSSSWQKCSLDHVMHNWPAKRIFCGIHISSVKYHLTLSLTSPTLKCKQTSWTSCLDWNWSFLCEAITVRIQALFLSFFLLRSISIQLRKTFSLKGPKWPWF